MWSQKLELKGKYWLELVHCLSPLLRLEVIQVLEGLHKAPEGGGAYIGLILSLHVVWSVL